jgi:hypothetical protein
MRMLFNSICGTSATFKGTMEIRSVGPFIYGPINYFRLLFTRIGCSLPVPMAKSVMKRR